MKTVLSKQSIAVIALFMLMGSTLFAQNKNKVFNEIAKEDQNFTEVFARSGGAGLKDLYAEDAQILPPNSQPISGNIAIGNYWKGGYDAGVKSLKLEPTEVSGNNEQAIEIGTYILFNQESKPIDEGKYMVVWKKYNNKWKLYRDIWNTSKVQ